MLLVEIFYEEIALIQKRHSVMFPHSQIKFIKAENINGNYELKFLDGYDLSSVITMEIQLAFKLIFCEII